MSKINYYYGPMNASKTVQAQATAYNYLENQMKPLLVKPKKAGGEEDTLESRPGLSLRCVTIEDLMDTMTDIDIKGYDVIIVDSVQFFTNNQVKKLVYICDELNIPIVCYGLRTDSMGNLFEGSAAILACADEIHEVKTICWCGKRAIYTACIDEDFNFVDASKINVKDGEYIYKSLCRKHYNSKKIKKY